MEEWVVLKTGTLGYRIYPLCGPLLRSHMTYYLRHWSPALTLFSLALFKSDPPTLFFFERLLILSLILKRSGWTSYGHPSSSLLSYTFPCFYIYRRTVERPGHQVDPTTHLTPLLSSVYSRYNLSRVWGILSFFELFPRSLSEISPLQYTLNTKFFFDKVVATPLSSLLHTLLYPLVDPPMTYLSPFFIFTGSLS